MVYRVMCVHSDMYLLYCTIALYDDENDDDGGNCGGSGFAGGGR